MGIFVTSAVCLAVLSGGPSGPPGEAAGDRVGRAVALFLDGEPLPEQVSLPLDTGREEPGSGRALDVAAGLVVIAGLLGLGFAIKRAGGRFNPVLFTALVLAVLYMFAVDDLFWSFAGVTVDEQGIAVKNDLGGPRRLAWSEVESVTFSPGKLFPYFMDDGQLVLETADGGKVRIPRWVPRRAAIGKAILDHLGGPSGEGGAGGGR